MESWVLAGIVLIVLALLLWHVSLSRRRARHEHRLLAEAGRDLQQAQDEVVALRVQQVALGLAVTDALLALDAERRVVWANPAARQVFGEVVGQTLIEATRSHELDALLDDARPTDDVLVRQVTLKQHAFGARLVTMPGGSILALEDISELQRLGRARRDFVANISHELRTPLASIRLLVDTLQAGALSDPSVAPNMLAKINAEVDALSQLSRELLDLAMIESGQMPFKLAVTDLGQLAQAQVERFLPQAHAKSIDLQADIPPGLNVLADPQMLGRVLSNLLHNALKFTPDGGRVSIGARRQDDNVLVGVSDTGPGIPPEALTRIFERFYKLDQARGQSGTGLGLAVARHIVEGHAGRIWAESDLGRGATFYFTLPVA